MALMTSDDFVSSPGHPRPVDGTPEEDIPAICAALWDVMEPCRHVELVGPQPDAVRDRLLHGYRQAVRTHIHEDARANLAELRAQVGAASDRLGTDVACTPLGAELLARLEHGFETLTGLNPYADSRSEIRWWLALCQFHLDGLFLADGLLDEPGPALRRRWRSPCRWRELVELFAPSLPQALVNALESAVPNVFRVNPLTTYLPTLLHLFVHQVLPGRGHRFSAILATMRGWLRHGGLSQLRGVPGAVIRFEGLKHLRDPSLLDPATGRTRHNVIIAASHRLGYLDLPLLYQPLRRWRFGIWVNNAFYGPGLERKLARDPYTVSVRGPQAPPLERALAQTAELLVEFRVPVLIVADGSQPPVFYGQQMRIKRGLRLAVNEVIRRSRGTGRRTYVLPVSLNDPVGFVQGRQDVIRVAFHPPVLADSVWELSRPATDAGDSVGDRGDPLLNYLEALFLCETVHARQGLPHPRIVVAARRRRANRDREPWLKRWFQTTLADLSLPNTIP